VRYETAIVTGASRGLGRAIGRTLAARGLNVMLAARSEDALAELAGELEREHPGRVAYTVADLGSPDSVEPLFEATRRRFGPADVLVNNAGMGRERALVASTEAEIGETIALNLTGLILCSRAALPDMLERRRGYIVNVGSDLCRYFNPGMAVYTATKFGVLGFSGSLLREVKDEGVRVTTVMPGVIDTGFGDFAAEGSLPPETGLEPDELAEQIAALLETPGHMIVDELMLHPSAQRY